MPLIGLSPVYPCLFCTKEPKSGSIPCVNSPGLYREEGSPPSACWKQVFSPSAEWHWLPLPQCTSLAQIQVSSTRISATSFSQKLLTCQFALLVNLYIGLFLSKWWTLHFLLLNLSSQFNFPVIKSFISCSSVSLARWDPSFCQHDSLMYQPLFQFCVICKDKWEWEWLRQHSVPHTTSLMKSIVSCISHWEYFLGTGLQLQFGLMVTALCTCHSKQFSIHFTLH